MVIVCLKVHDTPTSTIYQASKIMSMASVFGPIWPVPVKARYSDNILRNWSILASISSREMAEIRSRLKSSTVKLAAKVP
jgi:hypothetical protein